jgi:hypothetical protein
MKSICYFSTLLMSTQHSKNGLLLGWNNFHSFFSGIFVKQKLLSNIVNCVQFDKLLWYVATPAAQAVNISK